MGSGRRPGVRVDVCLLLVHRSGGVVFGLSLVFVFVGDGLTKRLIEGDEFQVRDLESYPLYSRCRVRDRWFGLAICFRVAW